MTALKGCMAPASAAEDQLDQGYAWVTVAGSFLTHVQCLGTVYTFTLYLESYASDFRVSLGVAALPGSLSVGMMLACGPFVGALMDKLGARPVCLGLALCHGVGLLLISACETPLLLIAAHALSGVGMSMAPASIGIIQQWFSKRRALATGLGIAGSGVGQFVFAQIINALISAGGGLENVRSWRFAMRWQSAICLGLLIPCALTLRSPRLAAANAAPGSSGRAQVSTVGSVGSGGGKALLPVRLLMRSRSMLSILSAVAAGSIAYMVPFVYLGPFMREEVGLSLDDTSWAISLMGIANISGRVGMGWLADRVGRMEILRASVLVMICAALAFPHCTSFGAVLACVIIPYGCVSGSFIAMPPSLIAARMGPEAPQALGAIVGSNWLAHSLGQAGGPPMAGLLLEASGGSWVAVMVCVSVSFGLSLLLLSCAWPSVEQHEAEMARLRKRVLGGDAEGEREKEGAVGSASKAVAPCEAP